MKNAAWDFQVAMGTGKPRCGHAPAVQSIALGSKTIGEKPLGHMRTEQPVAQKVGMFRNPKGVRRLKDVPAMGTGDLGQQGPQHVLLIQHSVAHLQVSPFPQYALQAHCQTGALQRQVAPSARRSNGRRKRRLVHPFSYYPQKMGKIRQGYGKSEPGQSGTSIPQSRFAVPICPQTVRHHEKHAPRSE